MDFLHLLLEWIGLRYVWRIKELSLECLSQTQLGLLTAPKLSLGRFTIWTNLTPSLQKYAYYQVSRTC